ncbi:hypothetical protein ACKWTF_015317 [Chironomus riparius]
MRLKVLIIFPIIFAFSVKVKSQTAECSYHYKSFATHGRRTTNDTFYSCTLNTKQANYGQKLLTFKGQHKLGHSDGNVKHLRIFNGNKLKFFSSIFCQKLPNLEVIFINETSVELFDENSLSSCKNLKYLFVEFNRIRVVPENLLTQNSKLLKFWIQNNPLTTLPENLFLNQKELEDLDLSKNQINFLPSNIFRPLTKLQVLYFYNNKLQSINPEWFVNLQNLRWLALAGNQISEIPSKSFASLRNLKRLWLFGNRIKTLKSDSFDGLQNLQILNMYSNEISDLPVGVFNKLTNFQELILFSNKLTIIHSDSFSFHDDLTRIHLGKNKINAIDPKVIDNTAVSTIDMEDNICSQLQTEDRSEIKPNLRKCFKNYQPRRQNQLLIQNPVQSLSLNQFYCGRRFTGQGNIIGGARVNRGDFPWNAALIRTTYQFFCGGSLISNRKVITAAHCIQDKGAKNPLLPRDMLVLLGVYDLNNPYEVGRGVFPVQNINMHPHWNPQIKSFDADIAVLVLENQVTFGYYIQPICLPTLNIKVITRGYVVGYGKSEDTSKVHENIPKIIETPIHENADCFLKNYFLATLSSRRTFCGGTGTGIGVCNGDSGSGLVVTDGSAYYLRAVVSSSLRGGQYGCDVDAYSVFTDVTEYVDWINGLSTSLV